MHIETDQIKSADTDKRINYSGNPGHIAKNNRYEVKTKQTNQQPIDCTDNDNSKCSAIQIFISHIFTNLRNLICVRFHTSEAIICSFLIFIHQFLENFNTFLEKTEKKGKSIKEEKLETLEKWKKDGLITEEEFNEQKSEIERG